MKINQQALSLFNYISGNNQPNQSLENIAKNSQKDVAAGISAFEDGMARGEFEQTLKRMENGEIPINLKTIENYFLFNQSKLSKQIKQISAQLDLQQPLSVGIQSDTLLVKEDTPQGQALQHYLNKDKRLSALVQQTAKLSQFIEWGQAKQQASHYQKDGMQEQQLFDFLTASRKVVTQSNDWLVSETDSVFASTGHSQNVIRAWSASTASA